MGVAVVCAATAWLVAVGFLWLAPAAGRGACLAISFAGAALGAFLAHAVWPSREVVLPAAALAALLALASRALAPRRGVLSPVGATVWAAWLLVGAVTLWWAVGFVAGLELDPVSKGLLWIALAVSGLTIPSAVVTTREGWEPVLRRTLHPAPPVSTPTTGPNPRVSIHVPCHAEPPALVIATLDRLAHLEYDNYEVLVIDNNTTDPDLWRPVRRHCELLGDRFRFFHVEGLTGAKAGALNWALPHSDPDATLIAVVDADYHVEPDWLRRTVGYFEDPGIGFVQCPHAYRDYESSRFATWANWEYAVFFQTGMVSLDNAGAGLTVGTMSLVRRRALADVGGWAEWCLTEDSELSIRIHAAGYRSIYLTHPYGRGLVPDTFEAYRRQRFRWTYGPVQEFRHHWRLFLPRVLGGSPSDLTVRQKLHHANHGIDVAGIGVRAIGLAIGACAAASMALHREIVPMPFELWIAATATLVSSGLMRMLVYRRAVGATVPQAMGGIVAFAALRMVIATASLRSTIGLGAAWHRTNKFRPNRDWRRALAAAGTETKVAMLSLAAGSALIASSRASGFTTMLAIALVAQGAVLLAAPLLALVGDHDLRRVAADSGSSVLPRSGAALTTGPSDI